MKKIGFFLSLLILSPPAFGWDKVGHRVVGLIAESYLTQKSKSQIRLLVGQESLAQVSTWADEIRSDKNWDRAKPWHYVNIPVGKSYGESEKNPKGDLIEALKRVEKILRGESSKDLTQAQALKFLIHFMGDLHQPLHVSLKEDRGGNDYLVIWFDEPSNLHRVWDFHLIDCEHLNFTEYASMINHVDPKQKKKWEKGDVLVWAGESHMLFPKLYPKQKKIAEPYRIQHKSLLNQRLLQGGIRLAKVLNSIFDPH